MGIGEYTGGIGGILNGDGICVGLAEMMQNLLGRNQHLQPFRRAVIDSR